MRGFVALLVLSLSMGCDPTLVRTYAMGQDGGVAAPGVLAVSPSTSSLTVAGRAATQQFRATDATGKDVTADTAWSVANPSLGSISPAGLFTTAYPLGYGGKVNVNANYGGATATVPLLVVVERDDVIDPSTTSAATSAFDGPTAMASMLKVVYPFDNTMMARNIDQMTLQWQESSSFKYFRIRAASPGLHANFYLGSAVCIGSQCSYDFKSGNWKDIVSSAASSSLRVTIDATTQAGAQVASASITLFSSPGDVKGGLYYFSTSALGIKRLPFGAKTAVPFVTGSSTGTFGCVGCHAVSHDGKKVAAEFRSGDGYGGIVDGSTAAYILPPDPTQKKAWNFVSYSPDGSKMITVWRGVLSLRDGSSGALLQTIDSSFWGGVKAAMPEWSADGEKIVFVALSQSSSFTYDFDFSDAGDIMAMPYNNGTFGAATKLVAVNAKRDFNIFPSWSPDSKWILFSTMNCSGGLSCRSYDQNATRLRLVSVDGGDPIELGYATHGMGKATNWPKFAPFIQPLDATEQSMGNLMFFTFSSKFAYGWVVPDNARPQLWMSAIDTSKLNGSGMDPSYPPFWLPFQDPKQNNHEAIWTTDVACTTDNSCPTDYQCVDGKCVPIPG